MNDYSVHICEVCGVPITRHRQAVSPDGEVVRFLTPLCCPGCSCGSYEEEFGKAEVGID